MNNLLSYFDKFKTITENSVYLNILIKTVLALAVAFIIWLILKRILHSVGKKVEKYEFVKANTQIFGIIRKALFFALVLVTGTYLIRLLKVQLFQNKFYWD